MSKKMGRPRVVIDWDAFDKLCFIQCTLVEIASFFNCSEDTIENCVKREHGVTFSEYHKKKSANGKMSLRRRMFKEALDGNITMQIWLSKQHLDMKEKREDKTEITAVTKKEIEDKRLELLEGQIFGLLNDNRAIDVIETVATHIPSNDK